MKSRAARSDCSLPYRMRPPRRCQFGAINPITFRSFISRFLTLLISSPLVRCPSRRPRLSFTFTSLPLLRAPPRQLAFLSEHDRCSPLRVCTGPSCRAHLNLALRGSLSLLVGRAKWVTNRHPTKAQCLRHARRPYRLNQPPLNHVDRLLASTTFGPRLLTSSFARGW